MTSYKLGCDVSFWQGKIDFGKMRAGGARFVFLRGGQGLGIDPRFNQNRAAANAAGLAWGAYWFLDYRQRPEPQAQCLARLLGDDWGALPVVLDVEPHPRWEWTPWRIALSVRRFLTSPELAGRRVMLYTNPATLRNTFTPLPAWLAGTDLWVAHYPAPAPAHARDLLAAYDAGSDLTPALRRGYPNARPFPRWAYWQFTAKGDGTRFGVESRSIDLDFMACEPQGSPTHPV